MYWNKKSNVEAPETADIVARLDWRNPAVISNYRNRKITNNLIKLFSLVSVLLVLYPVFDILYMFAYKGVLLLSIQTFTETTLAGGLSNAILGTIIIIGLSAGIAIPLGVFGGIYMAEFSDRSKYASVVRFVSDVLAGLPSIVVGYFGFLALQLGILSNGGRNNLVHSHAPLHNKNHRAVVEKSAFHDQRSGNSARKLQITDGKQVDIEICDAWYSDWDLDLSWDCTQRDCSSPLYGWIFELPTLRVMFPFTNCVFDWNNLHLLHNPNCGIPKYGVFSSFPPYSDSTLDKCFCTIAS